MARAYQLYGWLKTHEAEDGWHRVEGADAFLPWGTESPFHLHEGNDYLLRWNAVEQRWDVFRRAR